MVTCRSKRPGRSRAGSRTSGRLVAASTTTPELGSNPSISASSWFSVCSRSSFDTTAPRAGAPAADGVDLVDENDGGGALAGLFEQVANAGCADADEQFDEARARHREERHRRLARDRARQQGLAGTRRADHQHAAGSRGSGLRVTLRVLQEVDDLTDLGLGALVAGDVGERGARPFLVEHLGLRAADPERPLHAACGTLRQPPPQEAENEERQQQDDPREHRRPERGSAGLRCDLRRSTSATGRGSPRRPASG